MTDDAAPIQTQAATEPKRPNIIALNRRYQRIRLKRILDFNDFNPKADQAAYKALVEGDVDTLKALIRERGKGLGNFKLTDAQKAKAAVKLLKASGTVSMGLKGRG
jgi:hypothetical protein